MLRRKKEQHARLWLRKETGKFVVIYYTGGAVDELGRYSGGKPVWETTPYGPKDRLLAEGRRRVRENEMRHAAADAAGLRAELSSLIADKGLATIVAAARGDLTSSNGHTPSVPIDEGFAIFLENREGVKDPKTVQSDRRRLNDFKAYLKALGLQHMSDVRGGHFDDYLNSRRKEAKERKQTGDTKKYRRFAEMSALRVYEITHALFAYWHKKKEALPKNPINDADRPKPPDAKVHFLTEEELRRCLKIVESRDPEIAPLCATLAYAGLRRKEAMCIDWKEVDFKKRVIDFVSSKTKKQRAIPIVDDLLPYLTSLVRPISGEGPVFGESEGERLNRDKFSRRLKKSMAGSGLKVTAQVLRRSFCSLLLSWGILPHEVARFAGHGVDVLLKHYAGLIHNDAARIEQSRRQRLLGAGS